MRDAALEEAIRAWRAKAGWKPLFQSDEDHFIAGYRAGQKAAATTEKPGTQVVAADRNSEGPA